MERWVEATCMQKDEATGQYIGTPILVNVSMMPFLKKYKTSEGEEFTHIESDEYSLMFSEPWAHFLP